MGRPLVLNQTLHGYQDGHRLLASSVDLDRTSSSRMLEMSDLVGAPPTGYGEHYLSGYPLPGSRAYVIASTWPAPEVSRPGAAWTHSLLLSYDDIPNIMDVTGIQRCFRRPGAGTGADFSHYGRPVNWSETDGPDTAGDVDHAASWKPAGTVIGALYGTERPVVVQIAAGDAYASHPGILGLWSQQWPSLRRAFTFRTMGQGGAASTFDLTLVPAREQTTGRDPAVPGRDAGPRPEWLACLTADLARRDGGMHRYLQRYGSDAARPRTAFPLLVRSWLWLTEATDDLGWLDDLAGRTDSDLAKLRRAVATLEVLEVAGARGRWPDLLIAVANMWPNAPAPKRDPGPHRHPLHRDVRTLGELLDRAAGTDAGGLAGYALRTVARSSGPQALLDAIGDSLGRLETAAGAVPELLLSPEARGRPELAEWVVRNVEVAPEHIGDIVELALASDARVAADAVRRFGAVAVLGWLAAVQDGRRPLPPEGDPWLGATVANPEMLLDAFLRGPPFGAELLDVLCAGCSKAVGGPMDDGEAWNAATRALAPDDIAAFPRLRAYLFLCAQRARTPAAEQLFAKTFETIHAEYARTGVPSFPFLLFMQMKRGWEWDRCLGVRIALARAFVRNRLDPRELKNIVRSRDTLSEVLQLIREEPGGSDYLRDRFYR